MQHYRQWGERLNERNGVKAMCDVSENFRRTEAHPVMKGGRPNAKWKTLAELLQQNDATRLRILFYRQIALEWMPHPTVDVLAEASEGEPRLPNSSTHVCESPWILGLLEGYTIEGECRPRVSFPATPPNFQWGVGFEENRNGSTKRPADADGGEALPLAGDSLGAG